MDDIIHTLDNNSEHICVDNSIQAFDKLSEKYIDDNKGILNSTDQEDPGGIAFMVSQTMNAVEKWKNFVERVEESSKP